MRYGWSLKESDWDQVFQAVRGHTWSRCKLRIPDIDRVPEHPGVYMICTPAGAEQPPVLGNLYNAIYVGRASNRLRDRFKSHCNTPSDDLRRAVRCFGPTPLEFWFLEVPAANVGGLETALIRCLGPSANRISGSDEPIRVSPRPPIRLT